MMGEHLVLATLHRGFQFVLSKANIIGNTEHRN